MSVVHTTPRGVAAGRYIKAMLSSENGALGALAFAEGQDWRDTPEVTMACKAAVAAISSGDMEGATLPSPITTDFLPLIRARTLIDRISGFRATPLNVSVLRFSGGASAGFVGQNKAKPVAAFALERLTVAPFKVVSQVVLTAEVVRSATVNSDLAIARELAAGIAGATDLEFIDPHRGPIAGTSPGSVTFGATTVSSTGSTLAAIDADIKSLIAAFEDGDAALDSAVWVMAPKTASYLSMLRGTGGALAYPNINLRTGGNLAGIPVFISAACKASGSPGECFAVLLDPTQILLGDDGEVNVAMARHASIQMDGAPSDSAAQSISLWQNNLVLALGERYVGWQRGASTSCAVLENIAF